MSFVTVLNYSNTGEDEINYIMAFKFQNTNK